MSTELAISPISATNSPAQNTRMAAPDIVNDNFLSSFKDVLDTVNPLQQLPVVGSIYRQLTDSTISDGARIAGGALYGGPIGLVAAVANSVVGAATGKDIGGNVIAWLTGANETTQLADNSQTNNYVPTGRAINSYLQAQSLLA